MVGAGESMTCGVLLSNPYSQVKVIFRPNLPWRNPHIKLTTCVFTVCLEVPIVLIKKKQKKTIAVHILCIAHLVNRESKMQNKLLGKFPE